MREFLRRGGWVFLGIIIIGSALAGGLYSIASGGTSNSPASNYLNCPSKSAGQQKPGGNKKYGGAQLVDFSPVSHVGYLQCWDIKKGSGATATSTSTVTATYTGAIASTGKIFQSSLDTGQPFTASLSSGVIAGWSAGIPGMKVGGERRLLIPAQYAYGATGSCQTVDPNDQTKCKVYSIPPNADLVFDVTLLAVK